MRISDWSSDVCSSDLSDGQVVDQSLDIMHWALGRSDPESWMTPQDAALIAANDGPFKHHLDRTKYPERYGCDPAPHRAAALHLQIGRASCRERVCQSV